jgi:hypothetical protein
MDKVHQNIPITIIRRFSFLILILCVFWIEGVGEKVSAASIDVDFIITSNNNIDIGDLDYADGFDLSPEILFEVSLLISNTNKKQHIVVPENNI